MYQVEITFGHTTKDGRPVPPRRIRAAKAYLARLLHRVGGGARMWDHDGVTDDGAGGPAWERATTLLTYASQVEGWRPALREAAARVAGDLQQECVLLLIKEVNGSVELVEPCPERDGRNPLEDQAADLEAEVVEQVPAGAHSPLSISLPQASGASLVPVNGHEVRQVLGEVEAAARAGGSLFALQVTAGEQQLQLLLVVRPPSAPGAVGSAAPPSGPAAAQPAGEPAAAAAPQVAALKEICAHVEQALKDYWRPHRLARNRLVHMLNLERYRNPKDDPLVADGLALRRALDHAIDAIAGPNRAPGRRSGRWRLESYLHLRYREGLRHKDIAGQLGYTERHLNRLRKELIRELAELLQEGRRTADDRRP